MSKKIKGVILGSTAPYGVGLCEDDRARMKYMTLMQDYHELQKEVHMMRSRLDAGKQRKIILAAEVRFLRKRFGFLVKTKTMNSSQKEKLVQQPNLHKLTNGFSRREANVSMLPTIPEVRPKKKRYISKVALHGASPVSQRHRKMLDGSTMTRDLSHDSRVDTRKNNLMWSSASVFDLNKKERMHADDTNPGDTSVACDLNQGDSSSRGKESSVPSRAPIFDLNEASTGEEDLQAKAEAVKCDEGRRSLMRQPNDEVQHELMLSICRNAGEGASRVGKRKISWQDPVALRV